MSDKPGGGTCARQAWRTTEDATYQMLMRQVFSISDGYGGGFLEPVSAEIQIARTFSSSKNVFKLSPVRSATNPIFFF
jgi:hypothetical protein